MSDASSFKSRIPHRVCRKLLAPALPSSPGGAPSAEPNRRAGYGDLCPRQSRRRDSASDERAWIGPLIATAIEAIAPPAETFRSGLAAWVGLTPVQRSTGGKERLGRTSRMGERTLRRLLIIAASAVVRWAKQKGCLKDPGSGRMLERKRRCW